MQINYEEARKLEKIHDYIEISEKYPRLLKRSIELLWEDTIKNTPEGFDPCNFYYEELETLTFYEYRSKLLLICCLESVFEQDLYKFIKEHDNTFENDSFEDTKNYIKRFYQIDIFKDYPLIEEMIKMTNSIKHGEGRSFKSIKDKYKDDILKDSCLGIILPDGTKKFEKVYQPGKGTLLDETINIGDKILVYGNEVIKFWNDIWKLDAFKKS